MSIRRFVAKVAAAAALLAGVALPAAAWASPAFAATIPVTHCNVVVVGGYSPCRPKTIIPVAPITVAGPADPSPLQPPHLGRIV